MPTDSGSGISARDLEEAAQRYLRRELGDWNADHQADLEFWRSDPACDAAWRHIEASWRSVGSHADSNQMRFMLVHARRRATQHSLYRWRPLVFGLFTVVVRGWAREFRTPIGAQRTVMLSDGSRIDLDVDTRLRLRMGLRQRTVDLIQGQAQFVVAPNRRRPFIVRAGGDTVSAVGTSFSVAFEDDTVDVAMLSGKVLVQLAGTGSVRVPPRDLITSLTGGESLQSGPGGMHIDRNADIAAAMAWRQGEIIFKGVTLAETVRKMNHYSTVKIEIADPSLAREEISGVFGLGDTRAFVDAVEGGLPVAAVYAGTVVRLLPMP
jgi:transmembrane sensor